MSSELKPCPFCGGEAEKGFAFGRYTILCPDCPSNIRSREICAESHGSVANMWNTRAVDADNKRLREALEEIQDECKRKLQVSNYHMCVKTLLVRTVQALNACKTCKGTGLVEIPGETGRGGSPEFESCPVCN